MEVHQLLMSGNPGPFPRDMSVSVTSTRPRSSSSRPKRFDKNDRQPLELKLQAERAPNPSSWGGQVNALRPDLLQWFLASSKCPASVWHTPVAFDLRGLYDLNTLRRLIAVSRDA